MSKDTHVIMPLMGEGITEATLVKWLKQPGEAVAKDEALLEVSTDKVDTEIPSPAAGFLIATFADEGDQVEINSFIAQISEDKDAPVNKPAGAASPQESTNKSSPSPQGATAATRTTQTPNMIRGAFRSLSVADGPVKSSPLVRKMAADHGLDLKFVPGTGIDGRITRKDIELFMAQGGMNAIPYAPAARPDAHLEYGYTKTKSDGDGETLEGVAVRREKMTKMRTLTAEHMVRSVRTSAHAFMEFEVDLHKVVEYRNTNKEAFKSQHGFNLTFTPIFIHATVQAIKKHPIVNVSVDGEDILWKDSINIGCAVALEEGLIVPVLKNTQDMDLTSTASCMNDLVTRARSKKLKPDDVIGGTFSITNPGMFGSRSAMPIINQPQVAILCVNGITSQPVVVGGEIVVRPLTRLGLTFDHRVIDGEGAARFLYDLKAYLEDYQP